MTEDRNRKAQYSMGQEINTFLTENQLFNLCGR